MSIEVNSTNVVCSKCGQSYGRRKGNFAVSYGSQYKGIGYLTVCKNCVDAMYNEYLSLCNNAKNSVRQVCRKLDLYWNEKVFNEVEKKNTTRTMMTSYIAKINTVRFAGKSYDDTLSEEGTLWNWTINNPQTDINDETEDKSKTDIIEISDDIIAFWGKGYDADMYLDLEQRYSYWLSKFPQDTELDIGTEAIIRQICSIELDINRDRALGRPVDKSVNALNSLLGSANLKPAQKKNEDTDLYIDKTPMGVWAQRYENKRPIKEIDPELRDVDGIIRYITIWFFGHLCKMLGIKNSYCKLYEQEIEKMRVEHPEYDDEDDETFFNDVFCDNKSEEET